MHTIVASISEPTELVKIELKYTNRTDKIIIVCGLGTMYSKKQIEFREVY